MTNILLLLIINALFIIGLYKVVDGGMLLDFVGDWIRGKTLYQQGKKWRKVISKPLIDCPPCMASVWGTVFYIASNGFDLFWPVYLICLAGLVTLLMRAANWLV